MTNDTDLLARIDRLESTEAIRQLAARYALSLDMRDLDAHVNLFASDIRVSRENTGRAHLKRWPGRERYDGAFHALFPSWQSFWANPPSAEEPEVAAPAPVGEFLKRMRADAPEPRLRVR